MKTRKLLITLCVFLASFLVGGMAPAKDATFLDAVNANSKLAAPKLTVQIDGTKVKLSWNVVNGADEYVVHYAQYPYDNPDTIKTIDVGYILNAAFDLVAGSAYHVAVKAGSGSDWSDYSTIHEIKIPLVSSFKNSLGQEFKLIPAGTFTMGSPTSELARSDNETQHQVTLTQPFYMQTTEVTQDQWETVMGSNPSYHSGYPTCPVEQVSWNDAKAFIAKMNTRGEGTYGLPTEAQWEYAARAGSTTAFYNGGITELECRLDANLNAIGWYCYNSGYKTHTVAGKTPNAWGLYDMSGNVWEWCSDWFGAYPNYPTEDPQGPSIGPYRVLRGGCWYGIVQRCRSAMRFYDSPFIRSDSVGVRLVLSSGQQ